KPQSDNFSSSDDDDDFSDLSDFDDDLSDTGFSQPASNKNPLPPIRTTEDLTVVASLDLSQTVNDLSQTVADMDELPSVGLSNTEFMSQSDTHLERTAFNSMDSVERDASHASRQVTEMPAARPTRDDDDEFAPGDWIAGRYEVSDV